MRIYTVLVVDGEPMIRTLLRYAIASPKIEITEADSAESALNAAPPGAGFDLVITDIFPGRMDGLELAAKMVATGRGCKFLFISGSADEPSLKRIAQFRSSLFLHKPFAISDLVHSVRHLLETPKPERVTASVRRREPCACLRQRGRLAPE